MKIRNAVHADREHIAKLHVASITNLCHMHYSREQLDSWTGVLVPAAYDHALKEKVFLVAEDSRQVLLGLGMLDIEHAEVSAVYVLPGAARTGVGSGLLHELEKTAFLKGIRELTVYSTLNAEGFYARHGYEKQAMTAHTLPDGTKLECISMVKVLSRDA